MVYGFLLGYLYLCCPSAFGFLIFLVFLLQVGSLSFWTYTSFNSHFFLYIYFFGSVPLCTNRLHDQAERSMGNGWMEIPLYIISLLSHLCFGQIATYLVCVSYHLSQYLYDQFPFVPCQIVVIVCCYVSSLLFSCQACCHVSCCTPNCDTTMIYLLGLVHLKRFL